MSDIESSDVRTHECNICARQTWRSCGRCKLVWYCSKECQRYDYKVHKHLCSTEFPIYPAKDGAKPSTRVLSLPQNGGRPTFVEVPLETVVDEDDGVTWEKLSKEPIWFIQDVEVGRNLLLGRNLGYRLLIGIKEDALLDPSCYPNRCVQELNYTKNPTPHSWPGPLQVAKVAHKSWILDSTYRYLDVEIGDLRHVVDYFVLYGLMGPDLDAAITELRRDIPLFKKQATGQGDTQASAAAGRS
ncbi:hypothetical protein BDZ91DRAFT_749992 [Kalaharituber pfeilii]|nr:hypothetical protein BDZ91DRAFT_749992 [Kalaharituber pfeilii]